MKNIKVGYASIKVALDDATYIHNTLKDTPINGKYLKPHDMHMTLMYDSSNPLSAKTISSIIRPDEVYEGTIKGFKLLGDEGSEYRAVALLVDSYGIELRHKELSIFFNHSFSDYTPHVSIAYGVTSEDIKVLESKLTSLVGHVIFLYGESFATVKE